MKETQSIPKGYHTLTPILTFRDSKKAIEFYQKSLAINPLNGTATEMISKMQKGK